MRAAWPLLLTACTPEIDLGREGDAPVATILTPAPGTIVRAGSVVLLGRVSDLQDDAERLFVTWSLGTDASEVEGGWTEVCSEFAEADGTARCLTELTADITAIRLLATDVAGFVGRDVVGVEVSAVQPPEVELLAPTAGEPLFAHLPIELIARVEDADHASSELSWSWTSSLQGALAGPSGASTSGLTQGEVRLDAGEHTLRLEVVDPDGAMGRDEVAVLVHPEDDAPTCSLSSPEEGAVLPGSTVTVSGVAFDDLEAPEELVAELVWLGERSPVVVGSGASVHGEILAPHTLGPVALRLEVADMTEHVCVAEVEVLVDTPPELTVVAPAAGSALSNPVEFRFTVSDVVSSPQEVLVSVSSDRDGPVFVRRADAEGEVAVSSTLSPGEHLLTLVASDAQGLGSHPQTLQLMVVTP